MDRSNLPTQLVFWGGTGQAKVMKPVAEYYGSKVIAVFDDTEDLQSPFTDIPIFCGWSQFKSWLHEQKNPKKIGFCVAIGNPHGRVRLLYHEKMKSEGLIPVQLIHPNAWIADSAEIGDGCQISAGAVIAPEVKIGEQCIVNTSASIDHECVIESGVEISPGATLCGIVHVKKHAWICAGATILPRLTIGEGAIVGAGAVVTKNVPDRSTVVGVPAQKINRE